MYTKVIQELIFERKRDIHLVTPCCHKPNKDGKFVNYQGHSRIYGYCHSCGSTIKPPSLYTDEKGDYYQWNSVLQKFESLLQTPLNNVIQNENKCNTLYYKSSTSPVRHINYIDFKVVKKTIDTFPENNLLQYLRSNYNDDKVNFVKQLYFIGTSKKGGTVFWYINKDGKAQKAKVSYYTKKGKRSNRFEVPYINEDGYYSCLYGEHLLAENTKPIILVESEKTALVAAIEFPEYTWLAYSGINGLTDAKLQVLKDKKIILIPDFSKNAVKIINNKLLKFKNMNIDATVFDMTFGKTEIELKNSAWYNCDIEDIFRKSFL
ncbi:DUF6371 domain-containing protein [Gelidibacter japonicus]|uniref:DUF6371 domain-containing protein n=1 Tax=Gelidibacter japonicus TaxID=1962232 RepID=UPI003A954022